MFDLGRKLSERRQRAIERAFARADANSRSTPVVEDLIVSLTTFEVRAEAAVTAVHSMLLQTVLPKAVVVYVVPEEWSPESLGAFRTRVAHPRVLIKEGHADFRSYNKLVPALADFPDHWLMTVDDDKFYPLNLVSRLWARAQELPDTVVCYSGRRIMVSPDASGVTYSDGWRHANSRTEGPILPLGVGGILYPPNAFHEDCARSDLFLSLSPTADDFWFKFMTMLKGYRARALRRWWEKEYFPDVYISNNRRLYEVNKHQHLNEKSLRTIMAHYGLTMQDLL